MNPAAYRVRRATLDDLPKLVTQWNQENLPWAELEKRFTEFQIAETTDGQFHGAIGLQIADQQGCLHSEAFECYEAVDLLRGMLWDRMKSVATNHGLLRIWTRERSPYWSHSVFEPAAEEALARLPAPFGNPQAGNWLVAQLRHEAASHISLDKEFALFREAEKERTQQLFRQAKILKGLATLIAVLLFLGVMGAAFYFFMRMRGNPVGVEP